jgi:hypothetical protein
MTIEIDTYSRPRRSHIFKREKNDHYVEEPWCSSRLFDVEPFDGHIMDPACGWGTIVTNALKHGYCAAGSDIVNRGWDSSLTPSNFLFSDHTYDNIVTNPPFDKIQRFTIHAVTQSRYKTAILFPLARLPAARYIERLPLIRIWLLAPRPSMPPGSYIKAGGKVGGGRVDFCWLVFQRGYQGQPTMNWLHRKGTPLFNSQ